MSTLDAVAIFGLVVALPPWIALGAWLLLERLGVVKKE